MERNEGFVNWQNKAITQLGFANNLLLGLSIGILVYSLNIICQSGYSPNDAVKWLVRFGLIMTLLSAGSGLFLIVNRLNDFRQTASIVRKREKGEYGSEISKSRRKVKEIGQKTWYAFYAQFWLFFIGFFLLFTAFILGNIEKM